MKRIYVLVISYFFLFTLLAQDLSDIGKMNIGVVIPYEIEHINNNSLVRLGTKLEHIVTINGISSYSNGGFVLYPLLSIIDKKTVESGMRKIVVIEIELTLHIVQLNTNTKISTIIKTLTGSGYNQQEAINNAIGNIQVNSSDFTCFVAEGKKKIIQYYEQQYPIMITKAKEMAARKEYEGAIALLMSYPESLPNYDKISSLSIEIYKQYQNFICNKLLIEANGYIVTQDYLPAIRVLQSIDPSSNCHNEVANLMRSIQKEIEKNEAKETELFLKLFNAKIDLEKQRINAVKEVAKAYYGSQPNINYMQIIK